MNIVTDCELNSVSIPIAHHFVDVSQTATATVVHPTDPTKTIKPYDALVNLAQHPELLQQSGWLELTKLPGAAVGMTRWDVLRLELTKLPVTPEIQTLLTAMVKP